MNPLRPVAIHAGVLLLGGVAATYVWAREKIPASAQEMKVTIWAGRPADVQRLRHFLALFFRIEFARHRLIGRMKQQRRARLIEILRILTDVDSAAMNRRQT